MPNLNWCHPSREGFRESKHHSTFSLLIDSRRYPDFETEDRNIINAGKATACLIIEERWPDGAIKKKFGTAFFVSSTRLLTAGHNVKTTPGALKIESTRLSYAGSQKVDYFTNTVECSVLDTTYTSAAHDPRSDIAILECLAHEAGIYLPLSDNINELQGAPGAPVIVDIIGYPCQFKTSQKEGFQEKGELNRYHASMQEAGQMLPAKTLTVTRGPVEEVDNGMIRYKISTLPGLSGACLMYKGKVYGSSRFLRRS